MRALLVVVVPVVVLGCVADVPGETSDSGTNGAFDSGVPVNEVTDAGASDSGIADSGVAGPSLRGVFVATGYVQRTTISCDDGRTWIANQSADNGLRCFVTQPDGGNGDCDHKFGAGRGLAFGDGYFVANFGWGDPGVIKRSRDGVAWETVETGHNYASMVFSAGRFVAVSNVSSTSTDAGTGWVRGPYGPMSGNVRRGGHGGRDGGVFVLASDGPQAAWSRDGLTWQLATTMPATCGLSMQWSGGIAGGSDGTIVMLGGDGVPCRTTDNGLTWTVASSVGGTVSSRLVWTGSQYQSYGALNGTYQAVRYSSPDGITWTTTPLTVRRPLADGGVSTSNGPRLGPVARSKQGTWVGMNEGWQQWYEQQEFYRSTDGTSWDALPQGAFVGSHPMTQASWAEVSTTACP